MRVLGAYASELEQEFPFGIALQLFEPLWHATSAEDKASLLRVRLMLPAFSSGGGYPTRPCRRRSRVIR